MENFINILALVVAIKLSIVAAFFVVGTFFVAAEKIAESLINSYKRAKAKRKKRKNIIDNMEKVIKEWEK